MKFLIKNSYCKFLFPVNMVLLFSHTDLLILLKKLLKAF